MFVHLTAVVSAEIYKKLPRENVGKRKTREVIEFELNLSENLTRLSDSLREHSYRVSGYYTFNVYAPKLRKIHALHYRDRVVQHAICDEVLTPTLDKQHGTSGYFLKCDVRKFFENIDHEIFKAKLKRVNRTRVCRWAIKLASGLRIIILTSSTESSRT